MQRESLPGVCGVGTAVGPGVGAALGTVVCSEEGAALGVAVGPGLGKVPGVAVENRVA